MQLNFKIEIITITSLLRCDQYLLRPPQEVWANTLIPCILLISSGQRAEHIFKLLAFV